jgi:hypothetical protein
LAPALGLGRAIALPSLPSGSTPPAKAGLVFVCDLVILELTRLAPNERRAREIADRLVVF